MNNKKKKGMSREEAMELYRDLRKNMSKMQQAKGQTTKPAAAQADLAKEIAKSISASMARDTKEAPSTPPSPADSFVDALPYEHSPKDRGVLAAVCFVAIVVIVKSSIAVFESVGVLSAQSAQASVAAPTKALPSSPFGKEEIKILTSLDARRAELEERARKVEEKELELGRRDKEFVAKLMQLKDLTERLKLERDKDEKKKSAQLDQLANVYGSMAPQEAATLMEQLDITIALSLLERMPEKRIGQILALMTPERALAITKLLSGRSS